MELNQMIRSSRPAVRYFVWASALAFCGGLLELKTAQASDIWSGLLAGAGIGFVVAACIGSAGYLIKHVLPDHIERIATKLKIPAIVALLIMAGWILARVVQILVMAPVNDAL